MASDPTLRVLENIGRVAPRPPVSPLRPGAAPPSVADPMGWQPEWGLDGGQEWFFVRVELLPSSQPPSWPPSLVPASNWWRSEIRTLSETWHQRPLLAPSQPA